MAESKKSFILYADLVHTVRKMPDDKAGKLLKLILEYVNDTDPQEEDHVVDLIFEHVKHQLKRDLKQWEDMKIKRVEAGRSGGKQRQANRSKAKQSQANQAVNVNVNVNESVSNTLSIQDSAASAAESKEIGSDKVRDVSNDVWKDQTWRETICMGLQINMDQLKKWMALFNSSVANDNIDGFDKSRYKKIFRGWVQLQQSKGTILETGPPKTSNAPPLKKLTQ